MAANNNDPIDENEETFVASRTLPDEKPPAVERRKGKTASMVVVEGGDIGQEFNLSQGEMYIGRLPTVDIPIYDAKASRKHAKITYKRNHASGLEGYELVDLDSTNGTILNDTKITRPSLLREGDKVRIGETVLKFSYHDEIDSQYQQKIRHLINYDNLTGLFTKRYFDHLFEQELLRNSRTRRKLACLMMDLDHFKKVNDTHGHLMGSHVLKEVGALILGNLRSQDVVGRYGGEEFIAYLPGLGRVEAWNVANRLREAIGRHPFTYDGKSTHVFISIGVSIYPMHAENSETLIRIADDALYQAKETGRNKVVLAPEPHPGAKA